MKTCQDLENEIKTLKEEVEWHSNETDKSIRCTMKWQERAEYLNQWRAIAILEFVILGAIALTIIFGA
jgi:hypothetical protein